VSKIVGSFIDAATKTSDVLQNIIQKTAIDDRAFHYRSTDKYDWVGLCVDITSRVDRSITRYTRKYTVIHNKCGSAFVIITLGKLV